ncbi:TauD/TfdA family dioxygenase [Parvibaculaceae bacterium PLY_AMNH_Bact1]|nr:TauD/TfdA family dioxygenase [Parvibaculaceae bacterium PLY_AMNH_Bact1]
MSDTQQGFRSFGEQALHYFDRPHEAATTAQIASPAAWVGSDLPPLEDMAYVLSEDEIAEIDAALVVAKASGKATGALLSDDFPLPSFAARIHEWRDAVGEDVGFQVVRGVPVERWSRDDAELFFWCLGLHLGRPGGQNPQGDLLGHVTDTNASKTDPMVRLYQTSANIEYHCDAADVVGLLCLKKAKSGGQSRIVSSVTVFNELVTRRPDLVARLFEPFQLDSRNETKGDAPGSIPITPCCFADGKLRTFYHSDYFRSAVRHAEVAPFTDDEQALLDTYEQIAAEAGIYLDMDLQPGDIQLLSNHTNLHARTDYEDHEDPAERRHLLRLWLSL